jgi:hypothetical protein
VTRLGVARSPHRTTRQRNRRRRGRSRPIARALPPGYALDLGNPAARPALKSTLRSPIAGCAAASGLQLAIGVNGPLSVQQPAIGARSHPGSSAGSPGSAYEPVAVQRDRWCTPVRPTPHLGSRSTALPAGHYDLSVRTPTHTRGWPVVARTGPSAQSSGGRTRGERGPPPPAWRRQDAAESPADLLEP